MGKLERKSGIKRGAFIIVLVVVVVAVLFRRFSQILH